MVLAALRAARLARRSAPYLRRAAGLVYKRPLTRRGYHFRLAGATAAGAMGGYASRRRYKRRLRRRRARRKATRGYVQRKLANAKDIHCNYQYPSSGIVNSGQLYTFILGSVIDKNTTAGVDLANRIGSTIFYKGLLLHVFLKNNNLANDDADVYFRMMLVKNKSPEVDPEVRMWRQESDTNTPEDFDTTGNVMQSIRKLNRQKFGILRDKRWLIRSKDNGQRESHHCSKKCIFRLTVV